MNAYYARQINTKIIIINVLMNAGMDTIKIL